MITNVLPPFLWFTVYISLAARALVFANLSSKSCINLQLFGILIFNNKKSKSIKSLLWNTWSKIVFINFNLEQERSALATVTGIVANNTQAIASSVTDEMILELIMSFSKSKTVFEVSISPRNSHLKERNSATKSESMSAEYVSWTFCAAEFKSASDNWSTDLG